MESKINIITSRIAWVDWFKAILIILVVMGHCGGIFSPIIYAFHIPAFFFISGYLSNFNKSPQATIKSCSGMLYAIFIYNITFIILNAVKLYFTSDGLGHSSGEFSLNEVIVRPFIGIFVCNYFEHPWSNPLVPQFWFVWVLILMKLFYAFIKQLSAKNLILICMFCVLYAFVLSHYDFRTIFVVDRTITAFPFFIIGQLCRNNSGICVNYMMHLSFVKFILLAVLFIGGIVFNYITIDIHRPDLFYLKLGPSIIIYYITSMIGTLLLVTITKMLPRRRFAEVLSVGTFGILAIHLYMLHDILLFEPTGLFATSIVIIVLYPYILFANNYYKPLIGK